jgi:hypothetical protein
MATVDENISSAIDRLVAMGPEAGKAFKNANNFGIEQLRAMARHLKLTSTGSKDYLVDAIINKKKYIGKIAELEANEGDDVSVGSAEGAGKFTKNKHTMFRLTNLLMKYPAELQRSSLIATREQLQLREMGGRNPLFAKVAAEFNDDTNSGGLQQRHEEFEGINPERPHDGFITGKKCYQLWKDLIKRYSAAVKKWGVSGTGNELTFWNFCGSPNGGPRQVDVLYLRLVLNATNDFTLQSYCSEGCEIDGGLETSVDTPNSRRPESTATSSSRKRREEAGAVMAEASQKRARAIEEQVSSEKQVHEALAIKATTETIAALWNQMEKIESAVESMECAHDYDATNPSAKLRRYRAEYDRVAEQHRKMTAPTGGSFSTPV